MAFRLATSAAVVGVASATIDLAISDCGDASTHGHVTSISPTSVPQGSKTRVTGSGTLDVQVSDGTFTSAVKVLGVTMQTCSGDFCGASQCALPAGTGAVDFVGLTCPQASGTVSMGFDVTVAASIPSSLAVLEIDMTAVSSSGAKLLCAKINTSPGLNFQAVAEGACTSDEQSKLGDPQEVGKKANDCGTGAYNIFTGNFNHDKFNSCFTGAIGISTSCAECYAATGEYGAQNCKADCLLGWCKEGCLSCTAPAQTTLATCTGFTSPTADPCLETVVASGACTSDEQSKLGDPQEVGKKANDCGTGAYNIFTGNFNHDKFNSCFTSAIGISTTCAECYAATGEYGAQNCKADCLLGWCKEGCLSCTAPAQTTLATCTGFTSPTADPCLDSVSV